MNGKDDTENNNTLPGELINPKLCKVDHFGCSILDDAVKDSTGRKGNKRGKDGRGGDIVGEKGEAINFRNLKIMTDNTDLFPMKILTEREINEDQFRMEEEYNSEIEDEMADAMLCQFPPYGSHALSNFLSRHLDENDTVNNDSNHEDYEIEKAKEKEQWCEEDENADEYTAYGDMLMSHGNKDRFGVDYNGDDVGDCNLVEDRFDYDPNYQDDEYGNKLSKYQVDSVMTMQMVIMERIAKRKEINHPHSVRGSPGIFFHLDQNYPRRSHPHPYLLTIVPMEDNHPHPQNNIHPLQPKPFDVKMYFVPLY